MIQTPYGVHTYVRVILAHVIRSIVPSFAPKATSIDLRIKYLVLDDDDDFIKLFVLNNGGEEGPCAPFQEIFSVIYRISSIITCNFLLRTEYRVSVKQIRILS